MSDCNYGVIRESRVIVIGSGPAGYTAAIYAARANLRPLIISGIQPGGQLTVTTEVENYPGFANPVQGPWLMNEMRAQALSTGAVVVNDVINSVDFHTSPFTLIGDSSTVYMAEAVIIATGAQARWLGLESENRYRGHGVSACATCDGFFFRDKDVAVIGGGNSAVEEALYLTRHARKVTLVHRRDNLRAERVLQERLFQNPKVEIIWNHEVEEVLGDRTPLSVTGLRLVETLGRKKRQIDLDGVFIAIGHCPATDIFQGQVEMDEQGYIVTANDSTLTSVPGIFAAGDVKDKLYRQAITAAGMGCMAALEAERYLV